MIYFQWRSHACIPSNMHRPWPPSSPSYTHAHAHTHCTHAHSHLQPPRSQACRDTCCYPQSCQHLSHTAHTLATTSRLRTCPKDRQRMRASRPTPEICLHASKHHSNHVALSLSQKVFHQYLILSNTARTGLSLRLAQRAPAFQCLHLRDACSLSSLSPSQHTGISLHAMHAP
jgi:hypothetical protein